MKKFVLIVLTACSSNAFSQEPCNTVSSLDLSTGRDAVTSSVIPVNSPDPNWAITFLTPAAAAAGSVTVGQQARVCTDHWPSSVSSSAEWISIRNNGGYLTDPSLGTGAYGFEASRSFRVCSDDLFLFDLSFANDNFCTEIRIDGSLIFGPQAAVMNPANFSTLTPITTTISLTPGTHTISVRVFNFPVAELFNPHGFVLSGTVSSVSGNSTLVTPNSMDNCQCTVSNCSDTCYWKVEGNNIIGGRNRLGTISNDNIDVITNNTSRGIITNDGLLGWNTITPTAFLHVNCDGNNGKEDPNKSDIRFENLEPGKGNILVIGEGGYVFNSRVSIDKYAAAITELKNENSILKDELENLKSEVNLLMSKNDQIKTIESSQSYLYQNYPNPFDGTTTIKFFVSNFEKSAFVTVFDNNGKEIKRHAINQQGEGSFLFDSPNSGGYIYSLVVDGIACDSKKMVDKN